jgi:hypothetical protein
LVIECEPGRVPRTQMKTKWASNGHTARMEGAVDGLVREFIAVCAGAMDGALCKRGRRGGCER